MMMMMMMMMMMTVGAYWVVRSRLWHDVLSVCRLSVCNVLYCG